jgi:hypothetical protein
MLVARKSGREWLPTRLLAACNPPYRGNSALYWELRRQLRIRGHRRFIGKPRGNHRPQPEWEAIGSQTTPWADFISVYFNRSRTQRAIEHILCEDIIVDYQTAIAPTYDPSAQEVRFHIPVLSSATGGMPTPNCRHVGISISMEHFRRSGTVPALRGVVTTRKSVCRITAVQV